MGPEHLLLVLLPFAVSGESCPERSSTQHAGRNLCSGEVIFEDNFDNLDLTKWRRMVQISGEDHEFVTYSDNAKNSFVRDGRLVIMPTILDDDFVKNGRIILQSCTANKITQCRQEAKFALILPPVESAQLCTDKSFNFTYGQVTVRAKLPKGDFLLPEISLKPLREKYGAGYTSGKIKIASSFGSQMKKPTGEEFGSTFLSGGFILAKPKEEGQTVKARLVLTEATDAWNDAFHEYTLRWAPDSISFDNDGLNTNKKVFQSTKHTNIYSLMGFSGANPWANGDKIAPFDTEFYICLGVSVGGHYRIPDGSKINGYLKPWNNLDTKAMLKFWQAKSKWSPSWSKDSKLEVDYVQVTAL